MLIECFSLSGCWLLDLQMYWIFSTKDWILKSRWQQPRCTSIPSNSWWWCCCYCVLLLVVTYPPFCFADAVYENTPRWQLVWQQWTAWGLWGFTNWVIMTLSGQTSFVHDGIPNQWSSHMWVATDRKRPRISIQGYFIVSSETLNS